MSTAMRNAAVPSFPDAGLQHPELALLDRELRVEHVAVVTLEPDEDLEELVVDRGETVGQG